MSTQAPKSRASRVARVPLSSKIDDVTQPRQPLLPKSSGAMRAIAPLPQKGSNPLKSTAVTRDFGGIENKPIARLPTRAGTTATTGVGKISVLAKMVHKKTMSIDSAAVPQRIPTIRARSSSNVATTETQVSQILSSRAKNAKPKSSTISLGGAKHPRPGLSLKNYNQPAQEPAFKVHEDLPPPAKRERIESHGRERPWSTADIEIFEPVQERDLIDEVDQGFEMCDVRDKEEVSKISSVVGQGARSRTSSYRGEKSSKRSTKDEIQTEKVMPGSLPIDETDEDIEIEIQNEARQIMVNKASQVIEQVESDRTEDVEADTNLISKQVDVDPDNWLILDRETELQAQKEVKTIREMFSEQIDLRDTQMVAEYHEEIFEYISQLEVKTLPDPDYMNRQTDIHWPMRTSVVDWLLQIHMRYHMLPETLWIAVNLFDRFLSKRIVNVHKLQLVGVTSMFIAAKYEEVMAPSVDEFAFVTHDGYTKEEILKGERVILETLEFDISTYCTPYTWVRRISKANDYDIQTRTLSKFLMEATLLDHRFLRAKASHIAAIGMYMARTMLGQPWNHAFVFYSGFTEAQILTPAKFLVEIMREESFENRFLYKKYASKKFLKASFYARNWCLSEAGDDFLEKQPSRTPLPC